MNEAKHAARTLGRLGGSAPHEYTGEERAARRERAANARARKHARGPSIMVQIKTAPDNESLDAAVARGTAATDAHSRTRRKWAEAAAARAMELKATGGKDRT